jgi:hypothetical protein
LNHDNRMKAMSGGVHEYTRRTTLRRASGRFDLKRGMGLTLSAVRPGTHAAQSVSHRAFGFACARQAQTVYAHRKSIDGIRAKDGELSQHVRFQNVDLAPPSLSEIDESDERADEQEDAPCAVAAAAYPPAPIAAPRTSAVIEHDAEAGGVELSTNRAPIPEDCATLNGVAGQCGSAEALGSPGTPFIAGSPAISPFRTSITLVGPSEVRLSIAIAPMAPTSFKLLEPARI